MSQRNSNKKKLPSLLTKAQDAYRSGKFNDAQRHLAKVIKLDSTNDEALHLLGMVHYNLGEFDEAESLVRRSLALQPETAEALNNLGNILLEKNDLAEAVKSYGEAIRLNPKFARAYNNLGTAFQKLDRPQDAINCYNVALDLEPDYSLARRNKASLLWTLGATREAELLVNEALAGQQKNDPDALNNLGLTYLANHKYSEAESAYMQGLSIAPEHQEIRWNLSLLQLQKGEYESGWSNYDAGFLTRNRNRVQFNLPAPLWCGEELSGKVILLYGEQGIGDEIMFAQFIPAITRAAGKCIVACEPRLATLFQRSFPDAEILSGYSEELLSQAVKQYEVDYQCPAGSSLRYLATSPEAFPGYDRYLHADNKARQKWIERYSNLGGTLNVGISWRGGKDLQTKISRSTELSQWLNLLAISGANFINLQYGEVTEELATISNEHGSTIYHWNDSNPLQDMDDFAAQISALDLVISSDNSTVHMSGALGIPTWTLLPYSAEWRWGIDSYNSYWYPSITLFRQREQKQWAPVFREIEQRLLHAQQSPAPKRYISRNEMPRAVFVNDTSSWYHWGCTCTSTAVTQQLSIHGLNIDSIPIVDVYSCNNTPTSSELFANPSHFHSFAEKNPAFITKLKEADLVIINGEGTIHGYSHAALTLLYIAYISKTFLSKRVAIINHSSYPCDISKSLDECSPEIYQKVYSAIDYSATREPLSTQLLRSLDIDTQQSFDCLPLYVRDNYVAQPPTGPRYIVIAGGISLNSGELEILAQYASVMNQNNYAIKLLVGAMAHPAADDFEFLDALTKILPFEAEVVNAKSAGEWLDTIANATILVSGRFHHSIAAAVLGTPYIAFESNTPKISGINEILHTSAPIPYDVGSEEMLKQILERTVVALETPQNLMIDAEKLTELYTLAGNNFAYLDEWIASRSATVQEART